MNMPVPSTQLFVESLRLSAKQRLVLDVIMQFPEGARIPDITKALGIHVNTARGHINELEEKGAIKRVKVNPTGPGRPFIVYKPRVPDNRMVAKEYVSLINVLCAQLAEISGDTDAVAQAVGESWGAQLLQLDSDNGEDALGEVVEKFRMLGFDPELDRDTITLNSCPFHVTDQDFDPLVCAIHMGMLRATGLGLTLTPQSAAGKCIVKTPKDTTP